MSNIAQPRILSLLGCYWPGNEATGPSQSFRAFATGLKSDFDIRVVARDEAGNTQSVWQFDDVVPRMQLPIGRFGAVGLFCLLRSIPHDILLLNGFHDREFTIPALVGRKLGLIPHKATIVSPRGEFAEGALSLKSGKKGAYHHAARLSRLTSGIWFHATADHERNDIKVTGLPCRGILQAPNVRLLPAVPDLSPPVRQGPLRIAFLGRISPVKNLEFALDVLARVSVPVVFNIYGPIVDADYWHRLQGKIVQLPDNISVIAHGALPHDRVMKTMAVHDLFFLPTLGENFGHAINEALSAGLPVLISDKTPWRCLAQHGAGWDLPLSELQAFVDVIEALVIAPSEDRFSYRSKARALAERSYSESNALEANRQMLRHVLEEEATGYELER